MRPDGTPGSRPDDPRAAAEQTPASGADTSAAGADDPTVHLRKDVRAEPSTTEPGGEEPDGKKASRPRRNRYDSGRVAADAVETSTGGWTERLGCNGFGRRPGAGKGGRTHGKWDNCDPGCDGFSGCNGSHGGGGGGGCDGCDGPGCGCDLLLMVRLSTVLLVAARVVPETGGAAIVQALIRLYRRHLTRFTPACPSTPSCSAYALAAVESLGPRRGLAAAARRIAACGRPTRAAQR